ARDSRTHDEVNPRYHRGSLGNPFRRPQGLHCPISLAAALPPITNGESLSVQVRLFPTVLFRTRFVAPPVFSSMVRLRPTTLSATRKKNPVLPSMGTSPLGTWLPPPWAEQLAPGSDPPNATEFRVPITWTLPPIVAPQIPTATNAGSPVVPIALTF